MYDELMGITAFEVWGENFERIVNRYSIGFEKAADVACGTGLAAGYLAERCGLVYAVDRSASMLAIAESRKSAWSGAEVRVHPHAGGASVWELSWDPAAGVSSVRMTNFVRAKSGALKMSRETHMERAYELESLVSMITEAGFANLDCFDARRLSSVDGTTRRVQFLARA